MIVFSVQSRVRLRRYAPRFYNSLQLYRAGSELVRDGSTWAQNAMNDQILTSVIRQRLGRHSTSVDVGAAHGRFTLEMAKVARQGRVISIEPIPALFDKLSHSFRKLTNVSLLPCAVGSQESTATFWVCDDDVGLSGLDITALAKEKGTSTKIQVTVQTLDNLLDLQPRVDFIKLDIEGGELNAIRGANETLRRHSPVLAFECSGMTDATAEPAISLFETLKLSGYGIYLPLGFLRDDAAVSRDFFAECVANDYEFFFFAKRLF